MNQQSSISTSQTRLNNLDKILCKSRSDFETQYYPSQDASSSHSLRIIKASKNSDSQPKLRFSGDTESLVSSSQYGNPNRFDEVLHVQRHREILESVRQLSKSITNLDTMLQKMYQVQVQSSSLTSETMVENVTVAIVKVVEERFEAISRQLHSVSSIQSLYCHTVETLKNAVLEVLNKKRIEKLSSVDHGLGQDSDGQCSEGDGDMDKNFVSIEEYLQLKMNITEVDGNLSPLCHAVGLETSNTAVARPQLPSNPSNISTDRVHRNHCDGVAEENGENDCDFLLFNEDHIQSLTHSQPTPDHSDTRDVNGKLTKKRGHEYNDCRKLRYNSKVTRYDGNRFCENSSNSRSRSEHNLELDDTTQIQTGGATNENKKHGTLVVHSSSGFSSSGNRDRWGTTCCKKQDEVDSVSDLGSDSGIEGGELENEDDDTAISVVICNVRRSGLTLLGTKK